MNGENGKNEMETDPAVTEQSGGVHVETGSCAHNAIALYPPDSGGQGMADAPDQR